MAALIAFYSRAGENYFGGAYRRIAVGNTEKAAELLADITGGELFHIRQAEPYSDVYQTCIAEAQQDLRSHARPEVLDLPEALDAYDEIYLGYPNYWGTMPMAVYTFLEHYDFTGKVIHPFCTHEGSGLGYKAFLHNDGSLIRCLSIVLWDCFERKSAENDMEGLDFRSTSAPDIPYESSGKPVCHTLVKLFHYRDRVGDLMRSRFVQSVLAAGSCL
ncbi:MAG: hypothetical protein EGQ09_02920 [Clostridiales bacterium]|nr:hypothetical protein [Clostridiales bacterium]